MMRVRVAEKVKPGYYADFVDQFMLLVQAEKEGKETEEGKRTEIMIKRSTAHGVWLIFPLANMLSAARIKRGIPKSQRAMTRARLRTSKVENRRRRSAVAPFDSSCARNCKGNCLQRTGKVKGKRGRNEHEETEE
jgi:hypothetical protein